MGRKTLRAVSERGASTSSSTITRTVAVKVVESAVMAVGVGLAGFAFGAVGMAVAGWHLLRRTYR